MHHPGGDPPDNSISSSVEEDGSTHELLYEKQFPSLAESCKKLRSARLFSKKYVLGCLVHGFVDYIF